MIKPSFFTDQFLIAMPNLMDPNFFHSVTYICQHNEHGAMGIIINQPTDLTVGELVTQVGLQHNDTIAMAQPVFRGGPVDTSNGFVIHRPVGRWESTLDVNGSIAISISSDIITALAEDHGPSQYIVALGYAGWAAGQLEAEMAQNAWLNGPADAQIIFETRIDKRWEAAAQLLGVDINQLIGNAGHA